MADTWEADADNQAISFKAVRDYKTTTSYINYTTTPPDTRKCMTVGNANTYDLQILQSDSRYGSTIYFSIYSTLSFQYSDQYVLTKRILVYMDWFKGSLGNVDSCGNPTAFPIQGNLWYVNPAVGWVVGAQLYTTIARTTAVSLSAARWLGRMKDPGAGYYVNTSGVIEQINRC